MTTKRSFSDARRRENRAYRAHGMCTVCAEKLPEAVLDWGLVWSDKKTGICTDCLLQMRSVGFKYFSTYFDDDSVETSQTYNSQIEVVQT